LDKPLLANGSLRETSGKQKEKGGGKGGQPGGGRAGSSEIRQSMGKKKGVRPRHTIKEIGSEIHHPESCGEEGKKEGRALKRRIRKIEKKGGRGNEKKIFRWSKARVLEGRRKRSCGLQTLDSGKHAVRVGIKGRRGGNLERVCGTCITRRHRPKSVGIIGFLTSNRSGKPDGVKGFRGWGERGGKPKRGIVGNSRLMLHNRKRSRQSNTSET